MRLGRRLALTDGALGRASVAVIVTLSVAEDAHGTDSVLTSAQVALLEQVIGIEAVALVPGSCRGQSTSEEEKLRERNLLQSIGRYRRETLEPHDAGGS